MARVGTWEFVAVPPCRGQGTRSAVFLVRSDRGKRSRPEEKSQAQRSTSNNSSLHARLGRCQRRESSSASDLSRIYGRGGDDCARKTAGPDGPDGVPRSPSSPSAGWLARSSRGLVFRARRKHVKVDGGESLASRWRVEVMMELGSMCFVLFSPSNSPLREARQGRAWALLPRVKLARWLNRQPPSPRGGASSGCTSWRP